MTSLTDMHGYGTEFVVIKTNNPAFYIRDDRLTLKRDYDGPSPKFYNHRTKSCHQTFINNVKPYVEIKQFDLVEVRDDYGWRPEPYQFLVDLSEICPDKEYPIVAVGEDYVDTFIEMRKREPKLEPKPEFKATINGVEYTLNEETIKLILEQDNDIHTK